MNKTIIRTVIKVQNDEQNNKGVSKEPIENKTD